MGLWSTLKVPEHCVAPVAGHIYTIPDCHPSRRPPFYDIAEQSNTVSAAVCFFGLVPLRGDLCTCAQCTPGPYSQSEILFDLPGHHASDLGSWVLGLPMV
uniref:Uncharacterized protein n=1 Tax=Eutreptiella gymnastica TaxID=73025 RepID=A0A7S1J6U9_9EUGL|mmetsp:Transcript_7181/g.12710  ORF Transcript_7181/g.12710 Transcript_7181/m.12710 type:complete len:100 (+) Transcript_7181:513-812(+)